VPSRRASSKEWKKFQRLSYNESMARGGADDASARVEREPPRAKYDVSQALLRDECHDYTTRWFCGHGCVGAGGSS